MSHINQVATNYMFSYIYTPSTVKNDLIESSKVFIKISMTAGSIPIKSLNRNLYKVGVCTLILHTTNKAVDNIFIYQIQVIVIHYGTLSGNKKYNKE